MGAGRSLDASPLSVFRRILPEQLLYVTIDLDGLRSAAKTPEALTTKTLPIFVYVFLQTTEINAPQSEAKVTTTTIRTDSESRDDRMNFRTLS